MERTHHKPVHSRSEIVRWRCFLLGLTGRLRANMRCMSHSTGSRQLLVGCRRSERKGTELRTKLSVNNLAMSQYLMNIPAAVTVDIGRCSRDARQDMRKGDRYICLI